MWASMTAFGLGNLYYERKDYKMAGDFYEKSILMNKKGNVLPSWTRAIKIFVEKANLKQSCSDTGFKILYNYAYENKMKFLEGWTSRSLCEILMDMDDQHKSEAEKWIKRAIELDSKRGLRWNLATDYAVYSGLFKKNDDIDQAKEHLTKAIDIFKECGADGWVEKYEKELAAL